MRKPLPWGGGGKKRLLCGKLRGNPLGRPFGAPLKGPKKGKKNSHAPVRFFGIFLRFSGARGAPPWRPLRGKLRRTLPPGGGWGVKRRPFAAQCRAMPRNTTAKAGGRKCDFWGEWVWGGHVSGDFGHFDPFLTHSKAFLSPFEAYLARMIQFWPSLSPLQAL